VGHFRPGRIGRQRDVLVALSQPDDRLDSSPTAVPSPDRGSGQASRSFADRTNSVGRNAAGTAEQPCSAQPLFSTVNASAQAGSFLFAQDWSSPIRDLLSDVRVRYGIKLSLAGLLALFLTQILRLPDDAWAILTVLVMMLSQYVGSAAVKAITRVL